MNKATPVHSTEVSPLELFFDLVFVFAISQLSEHVLEHLDGRGVAEGAVMLVAVISVWAYTSFDATLTSVGRSSTRWMLLVVMVAGLFMNVAIGRAFGGGAWGFVVPMLAIQFGRITLSTMPAVPAVLKGHYRRALVWLAAAVPFWVLGAMAAPEPRLAWWAVAVAIDLAGTWLAHPLPGHWLQSESLGFDAGHMIERLRLFLIIALGEVVLTTGVTMSDAPGDWTHTLIGAAALVTVIALWACYFGASDALVERHVGRTRDPIRTTRLAMNGIFIVVAGIIAVAVANEVVIAHPHAPTRALLACLMFGGAASYIAAHTWYLHFATGTWSVLRLVFLGVLVLSALVATDRPLWMAMAALTVEVSALALLLNAQPSRQGTSEPRV